MRTPSVQALFGEHCFCMCKFMVYGYRNMFLPYLSSTGTVAVAWCTSCSSPRRHNPTPATTSATVHPCSIHFFSLGLPPPGPTPYDQSCNIAWLERGDIDVPMAVCTAVVMGELNYELRTIINHLIYMPSDEQIAMWREHLTSSMTVAVLACLEVII